MKTRKDHLVQLVAGLDSWPEIGKVTRAVALLAEIEKACPDAVLVAASPGAEVYTQERVDALIAEERERCAKIAETLELKEWEDKWIRSAIAAAIRGAK